MRQVTFKFLNRTVPISPAHKEMLNHKERRCVKVEAFVLDEISGLGIIK